MVCSITSKIAVSRLVGTVEQKPWWPAPPFSFYAMLSRFLSLEHYRQFLITKLLELSIVREVRSNIAIQTLKAGAPLPLDHLEARAKMPARP